MAATTRLAQIDGLRAAAALLVVGFHYTTRYEQVFVHASPLAVSLPWGHFGVNLFFIISGFVIFMTFDRVRTPSEFVVSRFSRLFPAYWAAILLSWLTLRIAGPPGLQLPASEALANAVMVHTYFGVRSVDGVYWSLAAEFVFYVWMLLLWCTGFLARPAAVLAVAPALTLAAALAGRLASVPTPHPLEVLFLLRWAPWFCLGMLIHLQTSNRAVSGRLCAALGALCLLAILARESALHALVALLGTAAVALAARGRLAWLGWRPVVAVGAISYPLYLIHEKLGWMVILAAERHGLTPGAAIACAVTLVLLGAWALHRLVEMPAMSTIRGRLRPGRDASSLLAATTHRRRWAWPLCAALLLMAGGARLAAVVLPKPARTLDAITLVGPSSRADIPCESLRQAATFTLLVLGQSNAGSHAGVFPATGPLLTLVREGRCLRAGDPLPGTTGGGSSLWTALDTRLRSRHPATAFVFAPLAIGATHVDDWTRPGPVRDQLLDHLSDLRGTGLGVDLVLWQQGEADMLAGTEASAYLAGLLRLRETLDAQGVTAPLLAARSTRCRTLGAGTLDRLWVREQDTLARARIYPGPDTDQLGDDFRRDGCHFNEAGRQFAAALWSEAVSAFVEARTSAPAPEAGSAGKGQVPAAGRSGPAPPPVPAR